MELETFYSQRLKELHIQSTEDEDEARKSSCADVSLAGLVLLRASRGSDWLGNRKPDPGSVLTFFSV